MSNDNPSVNPADLQLYNTDGSESGGTEEDHVSPPTILNDPDALKIALKLAPDAPQLRSVIQDLLQGDHNLEIPDDKCTIFNATLDGPKYTCGLCKWDGQRCTKSFTRHDRFKHHLQAHLGITPYSCQEPSKVTVEPKCDTRFSSIAARDTHVKNKGGSVMRDCGTRVLPKNFARHRATCSTCSNLHPTTPRRSLL